jgi:hypothetical protein
VISSRYKIILILIIISSLGIFNNKTTLNSLSQIKSSLSCELPIGLRFNDKYKITYNPYTDVDWQNDHRCLSQHHDHILTSELRIKAYDEAGYCAVPLFNYSGLKNHKTSWTEVKWPLSKYLNNYETDSEFLETTKNLKILFRSVEEVSTMHIVSVFLLYYIAFWEVEEYQSHEDWHYNSPQEAIDLININDGLAIIAHPWFWNEKKASFKNLENYSGVEIFTGFAFYREVTEMNGWEDINESLVNFWDWALENKSTRIWGFAVNDHYGPDKKINDKYAFIYDSGKTLAILKNGSSAESVGR